MTLPSSRKRDKALGREAVKCTLKIFSPSSKGKKATADIYHLARLFLPLLHLDAVM